MLAEFRVSNFRSFKDEQVLSLIVSCPESEGSNSLKVGKYHILKTAAIYGANASGKSNLIRALSCMQHVVQNSAGYKSGEKLPVVPFLFDEQTRKQPSSFEMTFFIDNVRHQYGFSATAEKIHDEWLLVYPTGRRQTWFERWMDDKSGKAQIKFSDTFLKGNKNALWSKVKDNSLFLSVATQWNHEQLSRIYEWVGSRIRELPPLAVGRRLTDELLFDEKREAKGSGFYRTAIEVLKKADLGITDIDIEKAAVEQLRIPDEFPEKVKEQLVEQFRESPPYFVTAYHHMKSTGRKYPLNFEEESEGTKNFYSYLGPLVKSVSFGYTILRDELESSLHPLLTREIVETVRDNEHDGVSAQLIFTTHDTTLLDPELFGRDQIWFTEKDESGATQLYSLADYREKPRKGEAMQKRYLAGRYGAVPIIERFDLRGAKK
ncbi:MAG: ATP-binding protein [Planctomycetota bacterium]|nr:MAG: ATP-binding protein [Planctomycetota bacterium]